MYSSDAFQRAEDRARTPLPPPRDLFAISLKRWFFVLTRSYCTAVYITIYSLSYFNVSFLLYRLFAPLLRTTTALSAIVPVDLPLAQVLREGYLRGVLRVLSSTPYHWQGSELFWAGYFVISNHQTFHEDVNESLCRTLRTNLPQPTHGQLVPLGAGQAPEIWSFSLFIDNNSKIEVPCAAELDDKAFVNHLRWFLNLLEVENSIIGKFSLLTLGRIEIAEMTAGVAVGDAVKDLKLGRDGDNHNIHLLSHPDGVQGNDMVQELVSEGVLGRMGVPRVKCLNVVNVWSSGAAAVIVGTPLFVSILCCVVWPAVAVRHYGADVQTSVQTGFAVGSFVVTVSALLIALVAFLDTMSKSNKL